MKGVIALVLLLLPYAQSYFLDTDYPLVKANPMVSGFEESSSLFGYSLDFFTKSADSCVERGSGNCNSVLIGAPRQPMTSEVNSGAVFNCPITSNTRDCSFIQPWNTLREELGRRLPVPTLGGKFAVNASFQYTVQDAWLGSSVRTPFHLPDSGGDRAMVCASRFGFLSVPRVVDNPDDPVVDSVYYTGMCLSLTSSLALDQSEVSFGRRFPCPIVAADASNNVGCQAGFSSDLHVMQQDDVTVRQSLIGAPIAGESYAGFAVTQQEMAYELGSPEFITRPTIPYNIYEDDVYTTTDSKAATSVAFGNFFPKQEDSPLEMQYVVGAPQLGRGAVLVQSDATPDDETTTPVIHQRLESAVIGQGFGRSVVCLDLNGDGWDEVVVGAPDAFVQFESGGAAFVFKNVPENGRGNRFNPNNFITLTGKPHSRFGYAVQRLGDLNSDGCDELAVGAPYERSGDDSGVGAVYVHFGSREHFLLPSPTQVIRASDIRSTPVPLTTFGSSFAGGRDIDSNGFLDVGIGAADSDQVVVLRSKPIVHLIASLSAMDYMNTEKKLDYIDSTKLECEDSRGVKHVCFWLEICFDYESKATHLDSLSVNITVQLDKGLLDSDVRPRAMFDVQKSPYLDIDLFKMRRGRTLCDPLHLVYLDFADHATFQPIKIGMNYTLNNPEPERPSGSELMDLGFFPVFNYTDLTLLNMTEVAIEFEKECGSDRQCDTQVYLTATFQEGIMQRSDGADIVYVDNQFVISVNMIVNQEPAYEPGVTLTFPRDLWFDNIYPECSYQPAEGKISCVFSNKAESGNEITKDFTFMARDKDFTFTDQPIFAEFNITFTTLSVLTPNSRSNQLLPVYIYKAADLRVSGASFPQQVVFGGRVEGAYVIQRDSAVARIGPEVTHSYEIFNYGAFPFPKVQVRVEWPLQSRSGKLLLYVTEPPAFHDTEGRPFPRNRYTCRGLEALVDVLQIASSPAALSRVRRSGGRSGRGRVDCFNTRAQCSTFSCSLDSIGPGQGVKITIPARLWNSTFLEDYSNSVHVFSHASAAINGSDYLHQQVLSNDEASVATKAFKDPALIREPGISWWIIILAVILGLLLLLVVIAIFAKCGFFNRRDKSQWRPPPQPFEMGDYDYRENLDLPNESYT